MTMPESSDFIVPQYDASTGLSCLGLQFVTSSSSLNTSASTWWLLPVSTLVMFVQLLGVLVTTLAAAAAGESGVISQLSIASLSTT